MEQIAKSDQKENAQAVVITGATSGIGEQLAYAFARRGFALILMARRKVLLDQVQSQCRSLGSPRVEIIEVDVSVSEQLESGLNQVSQLVERGFPPISIAIANAGISVHSSPERAQIEDAKKIMLTNVLGSVIFLEWFKGYFIKEFSKTVATKNKIKKPLLVGVSSIAGARGLPGAALYCASKAALSTYLEALRLELESSKIGVVDVAPGFIDTPLTQKNRFRMPFLMPVSETGEFFCRKILAGQAWMTAPWVWKGVNRPLRALPMCIYNSMGRLMLQIQKGSSLPPTKETHLS